MSVLAVKNLCKSYPAFTLQNISFTLEKGRIMGFIGRNGAGKSTTLKSLLNYVHPSRGEIEFFGLPFAAHEEEIKQKIGFVSGGINYYGKKKLRVITDATRRFYTGWDENAYRRYLQMFQLDENKTPEALSEGMKVKYSLALALSHNAQLLILDEPTSGLDPISRDDLLDVFLTLADEGISILFSTHITSDLDKCADDITYIKNGQMMASMPMPAFLAQYKVVDLANGQYKALAPLLLGTKRSKAGSTALIKSADAHTAIQAGVAVHDADLEEVMIHLEKE